MRMFESWRAEVQMEGVKGVIVCTDGAARATHNE